MFRSLLSRTCLIQLLGNLNTSIFEKYPAPPQLVHLYFKALLDPLPLLTNTSFSHYSYLVTILISIETPRANPVGLALWDTSGGAGILCWDREVWADPPHKAGGK